MKSCFEDGIAKKQTHENEKNIYITYLHNIFTTK